MRYPEVEEFNIGLHYGLVELEFEIVFVGVVTD